MSLIIEDELFVIKKTDQRYDENAGNKDQNILNRFIYQNELINRTFETVALHNYTT